MGNRNQIQQPEERASIHFAQAFIVYEATPKWAGIWLKEFLQHSSVADSEGQGQLCAVLSLLFLVVTGIADINTDTIAPGISIWYSDLNSTDRDSTLRH